MDVPDIQRVIRDRPVDQRDRHEHVQLQRGHDDGE
jgi:hypothetical protein